MTTTTSWSSSRSATASWSCPNRCWPTDAPAVRGRLRLGAAVETLGACTRLVDDAAAYVQQRRQFGRTLAEFAPVQDLLAWAATERHQLRALVDAAVVAGRDGAVGSDEWERTATAAKVLAGRVGRRIAQHTLQVTGGIGFTWEHHHHRLQRRALALDAFGGTAASLAVGLGRAVRTTGELPDLVRL
ncbi:acyl-CoA dehydrogenase family protein [Nocardioides sp. TF02-7]|uniref:acyl-CoA dehydrogenase family protein n=1 Tax=Nocardioides sp. TF02-7 TaxID=2917724 RepID=UPI001F05F248|nr:acyl-CoA dehydrogenase family protein [Nocardioides sp. TF02-7]UMG91283.1 hypothetical protein MF408_14005 [Nocardioides sp. TF02-7]